MIVETVLSMLTLVCHFMKVMHRGWAYFESRLAYTMACSTCWFNGMEFKWRSGLRSL